MKFYLHLSIVCVVISQFLFCHNKSKTDQQSQFAIDSSIRSQVLRNISFRAKSDAFSTKLNAEYYNNDTLSWKDMDSLLEDFWGRYWWHHDTLSLTANIGELSTSGFIVDIYKGEADEVRHNVFAHENNVYKIRVTDSPTICVEAPCSYSELVISGLPGSTSDESIFGFVKFRSKDYYLVENHNLIKNRTNMSFYFRAINFDLYAKRHKLR